MNTEKMKVFDVYDFHGLSTITSYVFECDSKVAYYRDINDAISELETIDDKTIQRIYKFPCGCMIVKELRRLK